MNVAAIECELLRPNDTRSVRLNALSVGPQRKDIQDCIYMYMYTLHRTGGTAKEPAASTAVPRECNASVRPFVRNHIRHVIEVANGTRHTRASLSVSRSSPEFHKLIILIIRRNIR